MNEGGPTIVSAAALGRELGLSGSRARELASTVFVKALHGYDLEASRAAYMASLRRAATGRRGPHKASGSDERLRLARLQGDALEIKNKLASRELISESEVEFDLGHDRDRNPQCHPGDAGAHSGRIAAFDRLRHGHDRPSFEGVLDPPGGRP